MYQFAQESAVGYEFRPALWLHRLVYRPVISCLPFFWPVRLNNMMRDIALAAQHTTA